MKFGNNVVVGANAVVVNDVPDNVAVGGVPAKTLYHLTQNEKEPTNTNVNLQHLFLST